MKSGLTNLQEPISFRYGDLQVATGNFSDANKLGRGGFAVVYKVCQKKWWFLLLKIQPCFFEICEQNGGWVGVASHWVKLKWRVEGRYGKWARQLGPIVDRSWPPQSHQIIGPSLASPSRLGRPILFLRAFDGDLLYPMANASFQRKSTPSI